MEQSGGKKLQDIAYKYCPDRTLLLRLVIKNDLEGVRLLLENGADVDAKSISGMTPS